MKLILQDLYSMHPKLRGYPIDLPGLAALAMQRAGHTSPVESGISHGSREAMADIEWLDQELALLEVLDGNRITEDGAEAVALAYTNVSAGWVVKRRLQRRERADWLLHNQGIWLALEVSGTAEGDPVARLKEKVDQVARCSLPAERLAVVVSFGKPSILADTP